MLFRGRNYPLFDDEEVNRSEFWPAVEVGGNVNVALTGVSSTASIDTLGVSRDSILSGNAITTAVGTLSTVVEERFVFDTCTDTDGTTFASHTPEIGGSISLHPSFTDTMSIQSNRVGKDSGTVTTVYLYSATPPRTEYTIKCDVTDLSNVSRAAGIAAWADPT